MPSIGFCLLLAAGLEKMTDLSKKHTTGKLVPLAVKMCCASTLILWSLRTFQRNGDWSNEEQLYRSGIPINPAKGN
jgi:hypothetical protein